MKTAVYPGSTPASLSAAMTLRWSASLCPTLAVLLMLCRIPPEKSKRQSAIEVPASCLPCTGKCDHHVELYRENSLEWYYRRVRSNKADFKARSSTSGIAHSSLYGPPSASLCLWLPLLRLHPITRICVLELSDHRSQRKPYEHHTADDSA